jgi:hypothetical protein
MCTKINSYDIMTKKYKKIEWFPSKNEVQGTFVFAYEGSYSFCFPSKK